MNNTSRVGGFAAVNSGTIKDCYCSVRFNAKKSISGGFVGENTGTITTSYSQKNLRGVKGGFAGAGNVDSDSCYFFHEEKQGSKKLDHLWDRTNGQKLSEINNEGSARALGFDLDNVWKYEEKSLPLSFIEEKWLFDIKQLDTKKLDATQLDTTQLDTTQLDTTQSHTDITISCADELFSFAGRVNNGDADVINANVHLTSDIDLGGKEWVPIGFSRTNTFNGVFDGGGFTVKNYVIKDKKYDNKGFFGFLKGMVYNLTVDCIINCSGCCGALVAQNNGGTIGCCGAVVRIKGGKETTLGGLVGKNSGEIFMCYVVGNFPLLFVPIWPLFVLIALMILLALSPYIRDALFPRQDTAIFNPVPYDPDAVLDPDSSNASPNADGNFVSFQFEHEIAVYKSTGLCVFNFKNPASSNHNIVVQLQFTDKQAKRIMGSTGRTPEEQEKVEAITGYNADTYRTVIAESGAIRPGYKLDNLRLVSHANGATIPPGKYNAVVYIILYDVETNNRAMLESQLPVVITVHK